MNQTCSGFINCNHPEKNKRITKPNYIVAQPLVMWNSLRYDAYSLIEKSSGLPMVHKNNKFTLEWNMNFSEGVPVSHYTFWPVRQLAGRFESDISRKYVNCHSKYVITSKDRNGVSCLKIGKDGIIGWTLLEDSIHKTPYDENMVWKILLADKESHAQNIKEGDRIVLENEKITGLLSKQADGCNFDGQPIFTMLNNYKISSFSNKVHGRGLHSESVPVCRFKDCDNECTMLEFQILGLNLTVNNALTLQNVESTVEDSSLNTTTVLDYGVYGAGFAVLFCLVLLLLVLLYYSFIPKEYDFVSNTDTGLLYENAKDLLSL